MEKLSTPIPGCYVLQPRVLQDDRGRLVKVYHEETFAQLGLRTDFPETYYSTSQQGVLRGLHFQVPPHEHVKCVTCVQGRIFDAVVDLRVDSPTYGQHFTIELDAALGNMLYVPAGLAHGFYVLSETAIFLNRTTSMYHGASDGGIHWESCGIEWPNKQPITSPKDQQMPTLAQFDSPFRMAETIK